MKGGLVDGLDAGLMAMVAGATTAIIYLLRQAFLPARVAGLASVGVAIVLAVLISVADVAGGDLSIAAAAVTGLFAGLSASGAWSGTKALVDK